MENYAIRRLQEQFITQVIKNQIYKQVKTLHIYTFCQKVATQVLFEEGVKYMEQEMEEIGQLYQSFDT